MKDFKENEAVKEEVVEKDVNELTNKEKSIINKRKDEKGYEYLELQSASNNGFKKLTNATFSRRFSCQKSYAFMKTKYEMPSILIDADSLKDNDEFRKILGHINTNIYEQKKGGSGYAK